MTILDCMMKALSVRELHEIPGVLMDVLLDHNKLERLIANMSGCYSYSGLLQEFEEKAADRKNYMQDYTPQSVMDIVAGISTNGCVRDVCAGIGGLSLAKYKNNPDAVQLAKELNEINRESRTLGLEIVEMLKLLVCTDPDAQKEHDEFVKEFTEFLVSSDSACTIEEQEAVIKK